MSNHRETNALHHVHLHVPTRLAPPATTAIDFKLDSSNSLFFQYGSHTWHALGSAITSSIPAYGQKEAALVAIAGLGPTRKMPERPLTIATYAAGASLAAITLVYVFGPTYFLDDEAANTSRSTRAKGVVGLVNPANDCFINSVLQALAGLPELRVYLIQEMHRRNLEGVDMYRDLTVAWEEHAKEGTNKPMMPEWKILSLQLGQVTAGLKDMVDALNERPIYKKTISAQAFIHVLESSFRTRISRTQQDAQELFQVVAERLADEHSAARRVRKRARRKAEAGSSVEGINDAEDGVETMANGHSDVPDATKTGDVPGDASVDEGPVTADASTMNGPNPDPTMEDEEEDEEEDETPFPFEGKLESQVECSHCHFKPKSLPSSFVSLTLHVPQDSTSTTLNACFDGMLKVEHIDDFTCDKCRLEHALQLIAKQLCRTNLLKQDRSALTMDKIKLESALENDPENPPDDVKLPDLSTAPKRRISRHVRISTFPRILAIHLSRSVWDPYSNSSKNMAKVAFPESLPLGGLLERKSYTLRGLVTHKGGHNSGHYESFRRQALSPPFSTPASMGTEGIYSLRNTPTQSPRASAAPSPALKARASTDLSRLSTSEAATLSGPPLTNIASDPNTASSRPATPKPPTPPTSTPRETPASSRQSKDTDSRPPSGIVPKRSASLSQALSLRAGRKPRGGKGNERWWRISDEKVKECKTADVLAMQREVYLLFYEIFEE